MSKRQILILIVILSIVQIEAQNLVINPGFELSKKGGPVVAGYSFESYQVTGWYTPTSESPDFFCILPSVQNPIPEKLRTNSIYYCGKILPYEGNAFVGFYAFHKSQYYNYQACPVYVGGTLIQPLVVGHHYEFSLKFALSSNSDFGVKHLGVFFSQQKVSSPHNLNNTDLNSQILYSIPQIILSVDSFSKWTSVNGEFIANGGEQYFVIGNFNPVDQGFLTKSKPNKGFSYSYYYIDEVILVDKNSVAKLAPKLDIAAGKKVITQNVYFDTNNSTLKSESFPTLDEIIAEMKKQPDLKVRIDGHTDNVGTAEKNQMLSEARAHSVANYFILKGIDPKRIKTKGYGSSKPVSNDNDKNRRVEFVFFESNN